MLTLLIPMTELSTASSTASDLWAARSAEKHLASVDGQNSLRGWSVKNPPVTPWSEIYSPAEIAAINESQIKMMNNDPLSHDVRN